MSNRLDMSKWELGNETDTLKYQQFIDIKWKLIIEDNFSDAFNKI